MTLGQRIQELRKGLNLSQEELGEKMGVSRQAISKWEGDQTIPELDKLIALSKLFGLTVGQLLGVEQPAPAAPPKPPRRLNLLLAGMGAAILLLAILVGTLWSQVRALSQQSSTEEAYVTNIDRTVFQAADWSLGGDSLDFTLKPVKEFKGWELIGMKFKAYPPPSSEHPLPADRRSGSASLPLSELSGGGSFQLIAVFQEKKTGRTLEIPSFDIDVPVWSSGPLDTGTIEVTAYLDSVGYLPQSLYLSLPLAAFD